MKQLTVRTDVAGSHVVVFASPEHYIDARRLARSPGISIIEHVRNGFVRRSFTTTNDEAPGRIVELIREHMT